MITHSYVDDVVGRALAKVDEIGETNRTIVVFHSDHGYQRTSVLFYNTFAPCIRHVFVQIAISWKHAMDGCVAMRLSCRVWPC